AFSVIREQFPKSKLAIGQGIITSMFASGAIVGLIVGAAISAGAGWRMTFISIIPITLLLPVLVWRFTPIGAVHSDWQIPGAAANAAKSQAASTDRVPRKKLDLIGAGLLAVSISTFLISLTMIETSGAAGSSLPLLGAGAACIVAFVLFIYNERRAVNPLIDLKLLGNRVLLLSNILIIILGFSMFMVFQTIPILAESPAPVGFGASIVSAAQIQLPFAIILLIFGPTSGFIVSKMGSIRPTVLGYAINAAGFFMLAAFHSQAWMVSTALAVISTGISLGSVGLMNIILLSTPFRNMVTSIGMTTLLRIVGSAVGPAIAGVIMELNQTRIEGAAGTFPSSESYTIIFLSAAIVSTVAVAMAVKIRQHLKTQAASGQHLSAT
ncbi:MAG TPA: MFS transporter, partial [Nitrososphaera sp.]|nr:MFS transporter [Nitrososphaera sp.]